MGLYNFQKRFVSLVLAGDKRHTIRAKRKHADIPGNTLHLYTGLRTKGAQLLMRSTCVRVEDIQIISDPQSSSVLVIIDGNELDEGEREGLARKDGFEDFADMAAFWKGRLPFNGDVIHWK